MTRNLPRSDGDPDPEDDAAVACCSYAQVSFFFARYEDVLTRLWDGVGLCACVALMVVVGNVSLSNFLFLKFVFLSSCLGNRSSNFMS